ncbi:unnamed protein product [Closterium sp. Naga37s-1]|nr:unnamed protein product [Closterium sp. Naga37s-1]
MVIAGATDYPPLRASAASVAYKRPPSASGTATMATKAPLPPAPKPVKEDAGSLPRPELSPREALVSQPGEGGLQAPEPSASPPVAPAVPHVVPTAAVSPPGAPPAADLPAPPVGVVQAIVEGVVAAQSVESATTDVLGPAALLATPAPPSAATLVPPPPVLARPAPAPLVTAHPAPPMAAPLALHVTDLPAPLVSAPLAPPVAGPSAPRVAAPSAPPVAAPPTPSVAVPPAPRPPSPGRRQQRPQSHAPNDERETSRHRHNSPRRRGSQANWSAPRGGRGGWWGPRQRGGGWAYEQPVTMADLQRVVSAAVREERNGQASQSNSPRVAPAPAALPVAAPPAQAAPRPHVAVPPPLAPSTSTPAPRSHIRLPLVPLVAGVEFVTAAGGLVTAQYPSLLPADPPPPSAGAAHPYQALLGPQRTVEVPEVTLGQIWRLSEALQAVHLIRVYGHDALSQSDSLVGGPRDECLDAADRLAELLAPVLAAPARGGLAGVGQLGSAVRGLRRFLHAVTGSGAIAAGTVLVLPPRAAGGGWELLIRAVGESALPAVRPAGSLPPPLPVPPQPVSHAGAHLVPPLPAQTRVAADPLSKPPQRQHPLVSLDPAPVARFPPPSPRAQSPPLPPDAPDPEDDEKWWNGELWESPPMSGTTWGWDWDMKSDFVLDVLRWERRMIGVGECLSHVATALEQLHAGLEARNFVLRDPQLAEQQQGVVREAAAQGLWRLLRLPLESEHPDENEGPGARAFRRVATAAEEAPLQLVPALTSLLRWIRRRFYVLNHVSCSPPSGPCHLPFCSPSFPRPTYLARGVWA